MSLDLVKTVTFAVLHFSVGFTVTYLLTGSVAISTGVALIEPAVNTVVFFFHEQAWRRFAARKPAAAPLPARGFHAGPARSRTFRPAQALVMTACRQKPGASLPNWVKGAPA